MDEYWDSEDQWSEEGRCIVCHTRAEGLVCSATCQDVLDLKEALRV